jgi:AcrR family transcriptional regulator
VLEKSSHPRPTPLSRALDSDPPTAKVTPMDAFKLARSKWLAGERLDVGRIAQELGVGRATVFRWVGTRENLYGEVISALFAKELARALEAARGKGLPRVLDAMERLLRSLAASAPLRRFVAEDPELAMRVLTSKASPVQYRCTVAVRELLDELVASREITPALPIEELSYIVVRITESFLYRDVITGTAADIETAIRAITILCSAKTGSALRRRSRA